ncbi:integral membrane protein, YkoY family [Serratia fonticola]|uniref:Integral membrane protein, YkoY family n=1 Tax=Serratia fonticola TaxID=47917 RepID=A0A4U9TDM1_SERFO|nr:integral membrane protein, YkoY family [Serratia fonticola]
MEWIADPTIWAGLATLVVLEIVLGIDNLIFIAILAEKLPKKQRDKARIVGLLLALVMRLALLASISWLATLTKPLFVAMGHAFSGRDLIMLVGGIFLLFKATMELNERLEGKDEEHHGSRKGARFWPVVAQIVVLDAVFSLDSVITAVGMVDHLAVMMIAVCIAIGLMLLASKPLTRFVNAHPHHCYSVPQLLADDWFQPGGRRLWLCHSEGLSLRSDRFLGDDRSLEPVCPNLTAAVSFPRCGLCVNVPQKPYCAC